MLRDPKKEDWLRRRLQEAVDKFDGGSADAFGRRIGYTNGGSVRQSLSGKPGRSVQPAVIERAHRLPELSGWFVFPEDRDQGFKPSGFAALSPIEAALVATVRAGLSEKEIAQLAEAVQSAIKTKNVRVSNGESVGEIGVYFGIDRRTSDVPVAEDRRELAPWERKTGRTRPAEGSSK